jgi:hypothetical protein
MAGGISDVTLLGVATTFRNTVTRKFRMLPARHIEATFAGEGLAIPSVKYDGEGVFVYFDAERDTCVAFNAPSGKTRIGLECTEHVRRRLTAKGHTRALFAAELYLKAAPGERSRVSDVIHVTSNGTPVERDRLALAVYDMVMLDGRDLRPNQNSFTKNWELIEDLFGVDPDQPCHRVEGAIIPGADVAAWFSSVTEERGLEGIVVRLPHSEVAYKIKPSLSVDMVAIGFVEGAFEGRYGVLSVLCALAGPDGRTLQATCRVGSGLTDEQRESLLDTLSPLKIDAPLNMADSDGRPITFVRPEVVIEVEGEALRDSALDGTPVLTQTFTWDGQSLHFRGMSASPKLTHPTVGCLRGDKTWDDGGTRMSQVMSDTTIARILAPQTHVGDAPTVIIREVYIKAVAVRKIIVVQRSDPAFVPLTVFWTDYSPGRKDPLKTETRIAWTRDRLDALLDHYRSEATKRGWTRA